MIKFSKALPIEFWLTGDETFNEKEVPGITSVCYCEPFNTNSVIKIQFKSTEELDYKLEVSNSSGVIVVLSLNVISSSDIDYPFTYELDFIPSDHSITNDQIQFKVFTYWDSPTPLYFYRLSESLPVYFYRLSESLPVYIFRL